MAASQDEGDKLAALWRERHFPHQTFEMSSFPSILKPSSATPGQTCHETDYVTFAVISDTHGKHGKFAGYEVPGCVKSSREYLCAASKESSVTAEIENVGSHAKHDFLDAPLRSSWGQVHQGTKMSIVPVLLLTGNRKGIVAPGGLPVPSRSSEADVSNCPPRSDDEHSDGKRDSGVLIPYADVLIHCGDFTMKGSEGEMETFCQFMAQMPHKHKLLVAGNHDVSLDDQYFARDDVKKRWKLASAPKDLPTRLRKRLAQAGVVYLEDSAADVGPFPPHAAAAGEAGQVMVRCFGSPVQPAFHDWAFQKPSGAGMAAHWRKVLPGDGTVDVLITHGPPLGRGDRPGVGAPQRAEESKATEHRVPMSEGESLQGAAAPVEPEPEASDRGGVPETAHGAAVGCAVGEHGAMEGAGEGGRREREAGCRGWGDVESARAGCPALLEEVQGRVRPLLHLFGHIHADHASDSSDGVTAFVNASLTDTHNNLRPAAQVKTVCLPLAALRARAHGGSS